MSRQRRRGRVVELDKVRQAQAILERTLDELVELHPELVTAAGYTVTAQREWERALVEAEHGCKAEGHGTGAAGELPPRR